MSSTGFRSGCARSVQGSELPLYLVRGCKPLFGDEGQAEYNATNKGVTNHYYRRRRWKKRGRPFIVRSDEWHAERRTG